MAGQLTVKELINAEDLANFFEGIDKSKLRNGNIIVAKWLLTSTNMKLKLKKVFHSIKYQLS